MISRLIESHRLERIAPILSRYQLPAIGFSLAPMPTSAPCGISRIGGRPDLPAGVEWPLCNDRPLEFLLQINLAEVASFEERGLLPQSGMLGFFYDLENQPWGYDPNDLDGYRVIYSPDGAELFPRELPDSEYIVPEMALVFHGVTTLPDPGSRIMQQLDEEIEMTAEEIDRYRELVMELESHFFPEDVPQHHLLGHSGNIQGDMQLEAQLVTNGLDCGDPSGYEDPRALELAEGADDWMLLLQLDTDDAVDLMWGDDGRLYFWIRREDLQQLRFDRVWMSLQCY